MAGELIVEVRIGGAVDPALGQVFSQIEQQIGQLESFAVRIGEALRLTTQSALPLATAFKTANDTAAESAGKWEAALLGIDKKLSSQLDTTLPKLTKAYQELGKAMESARLPNAGQTSQKPSPGATISNASREVQKSATSSVDTFASYDAIVSNLVIQGEKDPSKREDQKQKINAEVARMSYGTSLSRTESANQLMSLFDEGMTLGDAIQEGRLAASFTDSQQVPERVTAGLIRTTHNNGIESKDRRLFLNTMIGQVAEGSFGIANTAQAVTRLLPQVGAGQKDAIRLVAILQMESVKTSNFNEVISAAKARFLEYKSEGGEEANDLDRYGQKFMPKNPGSPPDYIKADLATRGETLESQQRERKSADERLSLAIGEGLAPIYAHWTALAAEATNILSAVVEGLGVVVTGVGGLVLGATGLVKVFGMVNQGTALAGAASALFSPQGSGQASTGGALSRWMPGIASATSVVAGAGKAYDTYQNATTFKEKAEGYGQAAGMVIGGVGGALVGARFGGWVGSAALSAVGGYLLGAVGKKVGGVIGDIWGDDSTGSEPQTAQNSPEMSGKLGAASKEVAPWGPSLKQSSPEIRSGALLLKQPGNSEVGPGSLLLKQPSDSNAGPGTLLLKQQSNSESGPGSLLLKPQSKPDDIPFGSNRGNPAPTVSISNAANDAAHGALGQYARGHVPQFQRFENGDVVRSLVGGTPAAVALPVSGQPALSSSTTISPQHFAVSPNIAINVQGSVTDPAELVRALQPEIQRMFNGFAAQANAGGQMYDRTDDLYGYS